MRTITEIEESSGINVVKDFDIDEFIGKTVIGRVPGRIGLKDYKIFFLKDCWIFDMTIYLKGPLILVDYQEFPTSYKINGIPEEMINTIKEVIDSEIDIFNSFMGVRRKRSDDYTIDFNPTITTGGYSTNTLGRDVVTTATSSSISSFDDSLSLSDLENSFVNISDNYVKFKL